MAGYNPATPLVSEPIRVARLEKEVSYYKESLEMAKQVIEQPPIPPTCFEQAIFETKSGERYIQTCLMPYTGKFRADSSL